MKINSYYIGIAVLLGTGLLTTWAVNKFQKPGHLDVITAQSMDMSSMRPPLGASPVTLATAYTGKLPNDIVYTGSIAAFNEQVVTPRIVGSIITLSVYPGDTVRAGQLVAQLDSSEVGARAAQAADSADEAEQGADVAKLTHHLHHQAAFDQAVATRQAATDAVSESKADESAAESAVAEAKAVVNGATANAAYWSTELPREKKLAEVGAVSQQDFQNEQAQAASSFAAVAQATAKVDEAVQAEISAKAKVAEMKKGDAAADASERMALADLSVAAAQVSQSVAGAAAAKDSELAADVVAGYSRIVSPSAGVVTERPVAPGTLVQPGQEILKIAEIDKVRIQANVAVEDLVGISVGTPVTIQIQDSGQPDTISSKVTSIFPSANEETRTAVVEAIVPNPGHKLLPGEFVTMHIAKGEATSGLLVPSSAIVSQNGTNAVWVASGTNSAPQTMYVCVICHTEYTAAQAAKYKYVDPMDGGKLVPVKNSPGSVDRSGRMTVANVPVTVIATDGTSTEIAGTGVSAGSEIVSSGQSGLADGTEVIDESQKTAANTTKPDEQSSAAMPKRYRCSKCGMIYSAAAAKKNHYVDPMDGGKLVPVTGG
jgi:multidrug efflux pump subunit AcrA (membrane-fusion protein)